MRLPHALLAPAETIAVVCFGFEADRLRRQPWHVAHGLARGFTALGHHVRILTDAIAPPTAQGYETERVTALFGHGGPHASLRAALARLAPSRIFLICGALRLARLGSLDLGAPVSLVMTSPRVHARELAALPLSTWWHEWSVLRGPLLDALAAGLRSPPRLPPERGRRNGLSEPRRARAVRRLGPAARVADRTAGRADQAAASPRGSRPRIVYLGPPLELRGAWLALESFEAAMAQGLVRASGTGRRAWCRGRRRWWRRSSTGSRTGGTGPGGHPYRLSRSSRRCASSSARACSGGSCGLRPGARAAPPCAAAWTAGALRPCCTRSMSP